MRAERRVLSIEEVSSEELRACWRVGRTDVGTRRAGGDHILHLEAQKSVGFWHGKNLRLKGRFRGGELTQWMKASCRKAWNANPQSPRKTLAGWWPSVISALWMQKKGSPKTSWLVRVAGIGELQGTVP